MYIFYDQSHEIVLELDVVVRRVESHTLPSPLHPSNVDDYNIISELSTLTGG